MSGIICTKCSSGIMEEKILSNIPYRGISISFSGYKQYVCSCGNILVDPTSAKHLQDAKASIDAHFSNIASTLQQG